MFWFPTAHSDNNIKLAMDDLERKFLDWIRVLVHLSLSTDFKNVNTHTLFRKKNSFLIYISNELWKHCMLFDFDYLSYGTTFLI